MLSHIDLPERALSRTGQDPSAAAAAAAARGGAGLRSPPLTPQGSAVLPLSALPPAIALDSHSSYTSVRSLSMQEGGGYEMNDAP